VNYFTILSNLLKIQVFSRSNRARLHASGAAEPDRHLIAVDDHRDRPPPVAEGQHALKLRLALLDVDVLERGLPPLKVVTGGLRIRSGVFAEDENHGSIVAPH
jgi:hypothetical protein